jgi:hypothetical protein
MKAYKLLLLFILAISALACLSVTIQIPKIYRTRKAPGFDIGIGILGS